MSGDAQVSDRALIQRVLAGDRQAAELFVARFTRLVWWILIHQLRLPRETAEEVYQNVFVHLWEDDYRRLRIWSGRGEFSSYLIPVVRHRALDHLGKQPPPVETDEREAAGDEPGPEDRVRLEEEHCRLESAVRGLPEKDRRLYELRFRQELSYQEIATALEITVNNVGVRLNRLLERLRAAVAEPPARKHRRPAVAVRSAASEPSID